MMHRLLRGLLVLVVAAGFLPAAVAVAAPSLQDGIVAPEAVADEELVLLNSEGRIVVSDPYVPAGIQPVEWQSPETGFFAVDTGDFNNDGDDEIVAIRSTQVRVYDPVPKAGSANVELVIPVTSGQSWQLVVTGKWFLNRGDGFAVQESRPNGAAYFATYTFANNAWQRVMPFGDLGVGMRQFAAGDVDGNNEDELIGIRNTNATNGKQILIWNPSNNGIPMYEVGYAYPWLAVASGNVVNDNPRKDDILATRSGVGGQLASFLVWRWRGNNDFEDLVATVFEPPFQAIATGDVTGNGDEEVFLLRWDLQGGNIPALTLRNYGQDSVVQWDDLIGHVKWRVIHAGDLDGDQKAELVVMSTNQYYIYTDPATGTAKTSTLGSFFSTCNFAIGNLDGAGIQQGPSLVLSRTNISRSLPIGQIATEPVQITNAGIGTLNWTATVTSNTPWLSVTPTSGTAPSTLSVQMNATGLAAATYTGTIQVNGTGTVQNSPQNINVTMTVTTPPFYAPQTTFSWSFRQGNIQPAPQQLVLVGDNLPWQLVGNVPADRVPEIQAAIETGGAVTVADGKVIVSQGDSAVEAPTVNWLNVSPTSGVAVPSGTPVTLSIVPQNLPYGVSETALVFNTLTSPSYTVIVYVRVVVYRADFSDATFMPLLP